MVSGKLSTVMVQFKAYGLSLTLNVLYLLVSFDGEVNFGLVTFINDVILDAIERRGVSRYRRLRVKESTFG